MYSCRARYRLILRYKFLSYWASQRVNYTVYIVSNLARRQRTQLRYQISNANFCFPFLFCIAEKKLNEKLRDGLNVNSIQGTVCKQNLMHQSFDFLLLPLQEGCWPQSNGESCTQLQRVWMAKNMFYGALSDFVTCKKRFILLSRRSLAFTLFSPFENFMRKEVSASSSSLTGLKCHWKTVSFSFLSHVYTKVVRGRRKNPSKGEEEFFPVVLGSREENQTKWEEKEVFVCRNETRMIY